MAITINKLNKFLEKLIKDGHGRKHVCINKKSFQHPLESDGCVILPVEDVELREYNILNEDGGFLHNGNEKFKTSLVLVGDSDE